MFYTIVEKLDMISLYIFLIICITDIMDGKIERKLKVKTNFGTYYDVTVDFTVILTAFSGFILNNIYSYWLLIIFTIMFISFILTSKSKQLIFDPFGKIYGSLLTLLIGVTIINPIKEAYQIIIILIIFFTIFSFSSPLYFLKK